MDSVNQIVYLIGLFIILRQIRKAFLAGWHVCSQIPRSLVGIEMAIRSANAHNNNLNCGRMLPPACIAPCIQSFPHAPKPEREPTWKDYLVASFQGVEWATRIISVVNTLLNAYRPEPAPEPKLVCAKQQTATKSEAPVKERNDDDEDDEEVQREIAAACIASYQSDCLPPSPSRECEGKAPLTELTQALPAQIPTDLLNVVANAVVPTLLKATASPNSDLQQLGAMVGNVMAAMNATTSQNDRKETKRCAGPVCLPVPVPVPLPASPTPVALFGPLASMPVSPIRLRPTDEKKADSTDQATTSNLPTVDCIPCPWSASVSPRQQRCALGENNHNNNGNTPPVKLSEEKECTM
jgi:hypothetical protein